MIWNSEFNKYKCMGSVFQRWLDLTDAYARTVQAMVLREPGARDELRRLADELRQCEANFLFRDTVHFEEPSAPGESDDDSPSSGPNERETRQR